MPEKEAQPRETAGANVCALCGEPVSLGETAVAVMRADGIPGVVHPACYPRFALIAKGAAARQARQEDGDQPRDPRPGE